MARGGRASISGGGAGGRDGGGGNGDGDGDGDGDSKDCRSKRPLNSAMIRASIRGELQLSVFDSVTLK
jgi:hypothetical protein